MDLNWVCCGERIMCSRWLWWCFWQHFRIVENDAIMKADDCLKLIAMQSGEQQSMCGFGCWDTTSSRRHLTRAIGSLFVWNATRHSLQHRSKKKQSERRQKKKNKIQNTRVRTKRVIWAYEVVSTACMSYSQPISLRLWQASSLFRGL